jgi:DNA repair protein RecO
MRHTYATPAFVLGRNQIAEASASVVLLTPDFGVIRARAQGVRKPAAKMAPALQTFALSDVTLVRGKDGWRMTGAILVARSAKELTREARLRAGRVAELLQRLVRGERKDPELFSLMLAFVEALPQHPDDLQDAAECLAALRLLHILGFDAGVIPGTVTDFTTPTVTIASLERKELIVRINNDLAQSGL